jgi:hypothetical protein
LTKPSKKPTRRECCAIISVTKEALQICAEPTAVTFGTARLCKLCHKRWNAQGWVLVYTKNRMIRIKARS